MDDRKIIKNKNRNRKNFNKKAARYFETIDGKYSLLMYGEVIDRINRRSFSSILDVGCGPGAMLARILNHHAEAEAFGLDLSDRMIEKADKSLNGRAVFKVGDADSLPWSENSFDILVCNASFHHYPEPYKVLNEMKRVLKPNGWLVMADPWWTAILRSIINLYCKTPFNLEGDYHIYSQKEIVDLLVNCGYVNIEFENPIGKYYIVSAAVYK
ncbi:MAG: class I SAM-dependent methyltransferase [Syntrophomonadaceae bacterium]